MHRGACRKATGDVTSRFSRLARAVENALSKGRIRSEMQRRGVFEPLEGRRLLAAGVVINEFMADNSTGYSDPAFPADHPDWIELYNPTGAAVNLQGWQLKDGGGSPSIWTFPAGSSIAAGSYLVVVADGKNLTNPAAVMHTNFSLSKGGEYLGLIKPDTTIANEFAPTYPPQTSDISYGIIQQNNTLPLVGPTAVLKATVPTNTAFDTATPNWKNSTFDDTGAAWISGASGVGFDANPGGPASTPGWNVHMVRASSGDFTSILPAKNVLDGNTSGFTVVDNVSGSGVNHIDYVDGGHFTENNNLPNGGSVAGGSTNLREQYAIRASAYVTIPAGTYTIGVNSDDGFQLTIPGISFTTRLNESYTGLTSTSSQITYGAPRGSSDTLGTFTLSSPLQTTINADMYERTGGDNFEVFIAPGTKGSVDNSFSLLGNGTLGWSLTTAPPNVPYAGQFGLNLQTQMLNNNATAYVRIPFDVNADDLSAFGSLLLHMKFDDGFVAWINGQQVASVNAPGSPTFNSAATASNPNSLAVIARDFLIPNAQTYIHAGLNVLAIQALNVTAADQDFLNVTTLDGVTGTVDVPRFFSPATPGTFNTGSFIGRVADTKFDHDRGFYSSPFQLVISGADTANGATIRYTMDGSTPSPTNGFIYTAPITINKTSTIRAAGFRNGYLPTDVDTQTYIFLTDVITQSASTTNTGTPPPGWPASWAPNTTDYGMDPEIVNNPIYAATIKNDLQTIPTLSVVTDLNNLFGSSGIYSNPSGSGIAWERPASLELINPDGSTGFQINAGLRLRGGFSRSTGNPKHALRILLRDSYGSTTLNYPLFKSMNGTDTTRGFDIRTFENYSWSFQNDGGNFIGLRDQFSRDTQYAMGDNAERGDMYNLYIDGQYWGIYNTDERPEADNAVSYYGGTADDYDTIKVDPQSGYTILATDGNTAGWSDFWNQTNKLRADADLGLDTTADYQKLMGNNPNGTRNSAYPVYLDPVDLTDYLLLCYFGGNLDAPISNFLGNTSPNNFYAVWNHTTKSMGFQYFAHDSEHTLLDVNANRLGPYTGGVSDFTKSNPQELFQQLLYNPDFRSLVADRIHKFLYNNGVLTPAANLARFNARRDEINRAIVGESARWGDAQGASPSYTYATWQAAIAKVTNNFFPGRTNVMINQFKTQAMGDGTVNFTMYPGVEAPEFVEQFGGTVSAGFVAHLTNPSGGTVYYTLDGSDPRLPGGGINPTALVYSAASGIPLSDTTRVQARVRSAGGVWSAVTDATFVSSTPPNVRISEIMYHPVDPPAGSIYSANDFEYIEIRNLTPTPINLKNYSFTNGINFTFPDMTLAGLARTVIVSNLAAFQSRYGNAIPIAGVYSGNLDNGGEKLTFNGALREVIQSFTYSDSWFPQTDGEGFSLVARSPIQPISAYGGKLGWEASNSTGGDPGTGGNVVLGPGSVVINEVGANVATPNTTFIELANTQDTPIDISGWFLSNDSTGANLKKYQFPAGTVIPEFGYLLLNEQTSYGQAGNPAALTPFTLNGDGADTITFSQADASGTLLGYREIQDYGATDVGQSLGRVVKSDGASDFVIQKTPTPGAANSGPVIGSVIINEVMYGPIVKYAPSPAISFPNPNLEYIELRNTTNAPIALYDPANPSNTWRITDGVSFTFPANTTIPAYGYVVISNLLPNDFRSAYNTAYGANTLPANAVVLGPMSGFLNNSGEKISLQRPGVPEAGGILTYINVDRLSYGNPAPWPTSPNQGGTSLIRKSPLVYGNDPSNWQASAVFAGAPLGFSPGADNLPGAAPTVILGTSIVTVDEGTVFTLNGSFSDPDLGQTWPVQQVNWGDGQTQNFTASADNTFSLTHSYKDNSSPATPFKVVVTIQDSLGQSGSNSANVTVANAAPTGTFGIVGGASIPEGTSGSISLTNVNDASYVDANAGLKFSIDWNNDGVYDIVDSPFPLPSPPGTTTPNPVSATVAIPAAMLADGPTSQTIKAKITDKDGGFTEYTTTLTVTNVDPVVAAIPDQNSPAPFVLNYTTGSFSDPGTLDTFTGSVDWNYHEGDTDSVPLALNPDKSFTLNHSFDSAGTFVVRVRVTDQDGGVGSKDFTVTVATAATSPTVSSIDFLFASGPRKISVVFSEDVSASLQVDDLTVHNVDANTDVASATMTLSWNANSNTATWTFGSLADANYQATLHASGVNDVANNQLAQDSTLDFWFLNGDANRDRSVGFADLVAVAQHYGQASGGTFAGGDLNGDGSVGFADLVAVAQNYGNSLAALPAPVPATLPSSAVSAPAESAPALVAAPAPAAVPPVPAPARTVSTTTNTPPKAGAVAPVVVSKTAPVTKPAAVSKPKAVQPVMPVSAFSTTRIAATVKKNDDDLFN